MDWSTKSGPFEIFRSSFSSAGHQINKDSLKISLKGRRGPSFQRLALSGLK